MGSTWLKVFLGRNVSEAEMSHIPHPRIEMAIHVTFKMVQTGTICGLAIVGPLLVAAKGNPTLLRVARYAAKYGQIGALAGLALGPAFSVAHTKDMELDEVARQCHRLRVNKSQLLGDRMTVTGFGVGYGVGMLIGESPSALAIFGICGGVLLAECISLRATSSQLKYHGLDTISNQEKVKSL